MSTVALAELKAYVKMGGFTDQDAILQILIDGCEDWAERTLGAKLASAARTDLLEGGVKSLSPKSQPITAITSITDQYPDPVVVTDSDNYRLIRERGIELKTKTRWANGQDRWSVVYTGGYATVPAGLKLGLLQLMGRVVGNRIGSAAESMVDWSINWDLEAKDTMRILRAYRISPVG